MRRQERQFHPFMDPARILNLAPYLRRRLSPTTFVRLIAAAQSVNRIYSTEVGSTPWLNGESSGLPSTSPARRVGANG